MQAVPWGGDTRHDSVNPDAFMLQGAAYAEVADTEQCFDRNLDDIWRPAGML